MSPFHLPGEIIEQLCKCETLAVLRLACVDISFNKVMVAISGFLVIMLPFFLVLFSYGRIVAAILHIHSAQPPAPEPSAKRPGS